MEQGSPTPELRSDARLTPDTRPSDEAQAEAGPTLRMMERLLNQLNDHYVVYDRDWRYIFVNTRAAEVLGYPAEQLIGRNIWELFPSAVGNEYYQALHRARDEQRDLIQEHYYPPFKRWFENHIYAGPDGIAVLSTDITERKQADTDNTLLTELSERIRLSDDLGELLPAAAQLLGEHLEVARSCFYDVDEAADRWTVLQEYRRDPALSSLVGGYQISAYPPAVVAAMRAGHVVSVVDTTTDPRTAAFHAAAYQPLSIGAFVCVPLLRDGQRVAVCAVFADRPRRWQQREITLLETVAERTWNAVEKLRLAAAQHESNTLLRAAMEAGQLGAWDWDVGADTVSWTDRLYTFHGLPAGSFGGTVEAFTQLVHPEDLPLVEQSLAAALAGRAHYEIEFRIIRPAGDVRWLYTRAQVLHDAGGRSQRMIGIAMDITERKRAEAALRASEARLAAFMEHSPGSMFIKDAAGRFLLVNNAFLATMGRTAEEVLGKSDHELLPADLADYFAAEDREVLASGVARRFEETFTYNGRRSSSLTHKFPLPDGSLGGISTDITEQKLAEERLQQLHLQEQAARAEAEEASRLKDEFLATVSHELRTPMTALLGYTQLLQRRKRDEAYIARTVEKMVQSAKAQAALIEDLLDVSRIVSGKLHLELARTDLVGVIHAALDMVRPTVEAKGLQLQVELDPAAGLVLGDAGRLQQVIWNLLSNAAKFTPPGGRIAVQLALGLDEAMLIVRDSGQGIAADFLPYVFDRFRQANSTSKRSHGGLGLGLAIVRHLVELHGGRVEVWSAGVDRGTTFTVRLPWAGSGRGVGAADAQLAGSLEGAAPLGGMRVLVVDDQPPILELLTEILTAEGATVQACGSAREALALVQSWRPDVLLSDIAMPGEDGYWLIERVRSLSPAEGGTTPALALTAYVRLEDRLRVLGSGFQQYVSKPVDAVELREIIARLAAAGQEL